MNKVVGTVSSILTFWRELKIYFIEEILEKKQISRETITHDVVEYLLATRETEEEGYEGLNQYTYCLATKSLSIAIESLGDYLSKENRCGAIISRTTTIRLNPCKPIIRQITITEAIIEERKSPPKFKGDV